MSSATIAAAIDLRQSNYLTVALLTLFAYDYVLTLPREIDHIWNKHWTMVSILFLLVRYCGLYILIIFTLSKALYLVAVSVLVVWIGSADLVMILRVWAIYSRSRLILGILLTFWVLEIIPSIITGMIIYPNTLKVAVTQVLDQAYCEVTYSSVTWTEISAISQIVNGAVMCILVIYQFVKRLIDMYKVTKRWHFNPYMNLLAIQSILYFLFIFFFNRTAILVSLGKFQTEGWPALVLIPLEYVPAFALTPRFIISIRALRLHAPRSSQGNGVDTGFGLSGSRHRDLETAIMSNTSRPKGEEIEPGEDIPMEEWRMTMEPGGMMRA